MPPLWMLVLMVYFLGLFVAIGVANARYLAAYYRRYYSLGGWRLVFAVMMFPPWRGLNRALDLDRPFDDDEIDRLRKWVRRGILGWFASLLFAIPAAAVLGQIFGVH